MGGLYTRRRGDNKFIDRDLTVIELVVFATIFTLIVLLTGRI